MPTRVVLFDLGGVLVGLGGVQEFGALIGETRESEVWRRWLESPWVRRFERGLCTRDEFAAGAVEEFALALPPAAFLERFLDWPKGLLPGAEELVRVLAPGVVRACFSNTNELHWNEQLGSRELGSLFERHFLSHEIGLVKPDREAFEHVVETLAVAAQEILFFDDNPLNVEGARAAGIDAHRSVGVESTRALLTARGLLRDA